MTSLYGRPTAAELVAAVAEFLETEVRDGTTGALNFHARVAANVLHTVERELLDDTAEEPRAALAAAIRAGALDEHSGRVTSCLRALVRHRLAAAHPGYDQPKDETG